MHTGINKISQWILGIKTAISNLYIFIVVYILIISIIYLVCIFIPEQILGFKYSLPALFYILFSGAAIVLTTWGERIRRLIRLPFPKGSNDSLEGKSIDQKKIRFLLILIYFIAIVIITIASLMSISIFNIDKMDYSVIQSFATYISYDRMVRNYPTIAGNR